MVEGEKMIPCPKCSRGFGWPVLRQTGFDESKPCFKCPSCMVEFYMDKEGKITEHRPFSWPTSTQKKFGEVWTVEKGWIS